MSHKKSLRSYDLGFHGPPILAGQGICEFNKEWPVVITYLNLIVPDGFSGHEPDHFTGKFIQSSITGAVLLENSSKYGKTE